MDSEEEQGCEMFKADGTRCGRTVCDLELNACRLHIDVARRQREFAKRAAEEVAEKLRQVPNPQPEGELVLPPGIGARRSGARPFRRLALATFMRKGPPCRPARVLHPVRRPHRRSRPLLRVHASWAFT